MAPRRDRLPVSGGPFDGAEAKPFGGAFRYLDAHGNVHREDGPGRVLYKRLSTKWVYAGKHRQCVNCGAVLERAESGSPDPCCLCGKKVRA